MRWLFLAFLPLVLAACDEREDKAPQPVTPDREAVTYFGGMILVDHPGPKAQVHLESTDQPLWFPSITDAKAFTLLPGEPKDITAIYVTDMTAGEWEHPAGWMAAGKAAYVIGSDARGGMGQPEAVPFSDRAAAEDFASGHGGRLVDWETIPEDYVIGEDAGSGPAMPPGVSGTLDATRTGPDAETAPASKTPGEAHIMNHGLSMPAGSPTQSGMAPAGESSQ